jgi:PHP domain
MKPDDPIAKAKSLPAGAVFHRCALQVNPHHYSGTFRGRSASGDDASHAKTIVDKAASLGVTVLAITDHNNVSSVPIFRSAAQGRGIDIFPGFEIASSEGVHVLCIYPPETTSEQLERYLGEFGIRETDPSSNLANKSFTDVMECVREQHGIAIAAHVTNDGGLLKVLHGQARINAWRCPELSAAQIPGTVEDLPDDLRPIVQNKNADYRREHPAGENLAVAVVNAKDIIAANDLEQPSATCWIKMSKPSIEGLRQAFLDPGSRIRLNPKTGTLETDPHAELVALVWEGGFLDGAAIHFNPNLNVLIGGRGTGKSTAIETIRTVLGLQPIGDEARKAHEGIVRQVLRSGTKISLLVRTHHPAVRDYRIERTIPNPPLVREETGGVSNLSPRDILPRIELYGQHEISELTKSREKLTRLLDRFVERDDSVGRRKSSLRRELEKNRRALLDTRLEIKQVQERLTALPGLEETLKKYKDAGLEGRLREQSLLVREERVLNSFPERLAPFGEALEILKRELPIDRAFLSPKALEELPGKGILTKGNEVLAALERDLLRIRDELEKALKRADQGIAEIRLAWEGRKQQVQTAYEKILRELQKSRVDGEDFMRLRRQIEELRPLRERLALLQRLEKEHSARRKALLAEWVDVQAEEFRALDRAAKNVSRKLRDRVQIDVTAGGDREPLFELLRVKIGGRMAEAIDALRTVSDLSLIQFVEACKSGADALSKLYHITPSQAERLNKAEPEVLMEIEELELAPTTAIRLNTAPAGQPPAWQALEDLSTGQKATAVLLLLLLESDAPLIVDQPEDDLDNRFITEGVVPRMRDEKQRRQFVFSTHNANIPVLGDAELILGLSASGEANGGRAQIAPDHRGSIDSSAVRELVEEILEGGREAFETRRRKYGF